MIVDQFGRPFTPAARQPDRRVDATSAAVRAFIRPAWIQSVTPGMGPEKLARILRELQSGSECQDFLTLADDMEDRDPHYYSVLQTRKLAITGTLLHLEPPQIDPPQPQRKPGQPPQAKSKEQQTAEYIAEETWKHLVNCAAFREMVSALCDGLSKGFSVVQLEWDPTHRPYWGVRYTYEDQRKFRFDRDTQTQLRVRDMTADGVELEPGRFIVHYPRLRPGPPLKGALARVAAVTWMFKNFTVRDWVAFAEVYGMPLRVATYDPNVMTADEIADLRFALSNMGHDAAGLIPRGVELEVHDVNRGSSGGPFKDMAEYWDKQLSKAVLGQTMTSDDGASLAQSQTHEKVRQDIRVADCLALFGGTIQAALITPWVQLNFGEDAPVPQLCEQPPEEDIDAFTKAVVPWVQAGLEVSASSVRERLGIEPPTGDDDMIAPPAPEPDPNAPPIGKGKQPKVEPNRATSRLPLNLQIAEDIASSLAENWEVLLTPYVRVLESLARKSQSFEDFALALNTATERMDSSEFVRQLAVASMEARGVGQGLPT